jgi:hypothetical protein
VVWRDLRQCHAVEFADRDLPQPSGRAVVIDGSSYFGALRTREDFGCVLHELNQPPLESIRMQYGACLLTTHDSVYGQRSFKVPERLRYVGMTTSGKWSGAPSKDGPWEPLEELDALPD